MLLFDLVYLCVLALLSPWLVWRSIRTGRYRHDLRAKLLGTNVKANPTHTVAWFHGVSVGEIHLLVTVIAAFKKRFPDWRVAVSSTTDTGLAEARNRFPNDTVLAFPFDFSWAVGRTLDAVKPAIILLAESEMWPGFLAQASKRKIPVVVINARMSPRSYKRIRRFAGLVRRLLYRHVSYFAVQSQDYADRLRSLGVSDDKLVVTGSVKYDGASGDRDTSKARAFREMLGVQLSGGTDIPVCDSNEPQTGMSVAPNLILLAGSTHAPEEEIVLRVFAKLRSRHPQLKLILVPRHPDRFVEVAGLVEKSGIPFIRRSLIKQPLTEMPAIVLLDTVGELGAAWSLAHLGYTGGSLDGKRGGQSMIEPAGYGVPAVFGPHVWNFRDASRRLLDAGGATMVQDEAELESALENLIVDEPKRTAMGAKAAELVRQQQGATERTLDVIAKVM